MNEKEVTEKVFKCVPATNIPILAANFPSNYIIK